MKRTLVAVALAVIFVLALAAPAVAMFHTATYEMDGTIALKKQAGHACNTGGVLKQTIAGNGVMDKVMTVTMVPGKLTVSDTNDWVAGATSLTVTSVWELCTPPKYTYDDGTYEAPVSIMSMYSTHSMPAYFTGVGGHMTYNGMTMGTLAAANGWDALTDQIWAVQVAADPGFSGNLHQDGEAAYGSYWGNATAVHAFDALWQSTVYDNSGKWRWELDEDGVKGVSIGADFVGDYFNMSQMARTSQGTLKRYIDISSPWSHAYLMEDMSVVGKSEITEAFSMPNIAAGADVPGLWYDLF